MVGLFGMIEFTIEECPSVLLLGSPLLGKHMLQVREKIIRRSGQVVGPVKSLFDTVSLPQLPERVIEPGAIPLEKGDALPSRLLHGLEAAVIRAAVVPYVTHLRAGNDQPLPLCQPRWQMGTAPLTLAVFQYTRSSQASICRWNSSSHSGSSSRDSSYTGSSEGHSRGRCAGTAWTARRETRRSRSTAGTRTLVHLPELEQPVGRPRTAIPDLDEEAPILLWQV